MNILIADDRHLDRDSLRDVITEIIPACTICEASSTKQLFSELSKMWDLLFLDISFSGDHEPNDDGLYALLEIVNSYPALPVCLVTGHYKEKLPKFIQQFLGTTLQVINFLDKSNYSEDDVKCTITKAHEHQLKFKKNIEDKRASEELILEAAEEANRKFVASAFFELHDRLSHSDMLKTAFTGDDWSSRIEAEAKLTNGMCKVNAALLCIEMDRSIQTLCLPNAGKIEKYYQKLDYIAVQYDIRWLDKGLMHEAWETRNKIVHASMVADRDDAYLLLKCVRLLLKKQPKNGSCRSTMMPVSPPQGRGKSKRDQSKSVPA